MTPKRAAWPRIGETTSPEEMGRVIRDAIPLIEDDVLIEVMKKIKNQYRSSFWPSFGTTEQCREATRDGFNMAIDIVLDTLDLLRENRA